MAGPVVNGEPGATTPTAARVQWTWQRRDQYWPLTVMGVVLLSAAVAMALFGLPSVGLRSPSHLLGIMSPTCGGTRAARYTAMGEWALAWRYNPLGLIVVIASAAASARAVGGLLTRRWLDVRIRWSRSGATAAITLLVLLLIALWARQQLNAELLVAGT